MPEATASSESVATRPSAGVMLIQSPPCKMSARAGRAAPPAHALVRYYWLLLALGALVRFLGREELLSWAREKLDM
jgi:hypothetical protein